MGQDVKSFGSGSNKENKLDWTKGLRGSPKKGLRLCEMNMTNETKSFEKLKRTREG